MAYIVKAGDRYQVRQGNNHRVISEYSGKNALARAREDVRRLHAKNDPKGSNRGKAADPQSTSLRR